MHSYLTLKSAAKKKKMEKIYKNLKKNEYLIFYVPMWLDFLAF